MSSRKKKPTARKSAKRKLATRKSAAPKPAAKRAGKAASRRATKPAAKASRKAAPTKPAARKVAPASPPVAPPSPGATTVERVKLDAPVSDFTAPATGGLQWRLQDARGRKLVLYFYPRDNTPGCTLEGQQFSALAPQFAAAGVTVLGISRDSIASHEKFREKMGFPFDLLSDDGEAICRQFDVIREKNMYGRKVLGIERSTFLLDAAGVLKREWRGVKVEGHAQEVLAAAQAL
jgi:peroxiredoxin Q/BCP